MQSSESELCIYIGLISSFYDIYTVYDPFPYLLTISISDIEIVSK